MIGTSWDLTAVLSKSVISVSYRQEKRSAFTVQRGRVTLASTHLAPSFPHDVLKVHARCLSDIQRGSIILYQRQDEQQEPRLQFRAVEVLFCRMTDFRERGEGLRQEGREHGEVFCCCLHFGGLFYSLLRGGQRDDMNQAEAELKPLNSWLII